MLGEYKINILNEYGMTRDAVMEFQTLRLFDVLNDSGSWSISGTTIEKNKFQAGDSICVYRNGKKIFGGVLTDFEEEYNFTTKTWKWSASGKTWIELTKWRYVTPDAADSSLEFENRELVFDNVDAKVAAKKMLEENLVGPITFRNNRAVLGYSLVKSVIKTSGSADAISGVYRFDNLYDSIAGIANAASLAIYPVFEESAGGVVFYVTEGKDVSQSVVFSEGAGNISTYKRIVTTPEATDILASYNSDDQFVIGDQMWRYAAGAPISATRNYLTKEKFYKPEAEDFQEYYAYDRLLDLAHREAQNTPVLTEGYDIRLNLSTGITYNYGYSYANGSFTDDYRLGDTVGMFVLGQSFTAQVTAIEFNVSYGKETITPTLGMVKKGKFNNIQKDISSNNKRILKINNTGVVS